MKHHKLLLPFALLVSTYAPLVHSADILTANQVWSLVDQQHGNVYAPATFKHNGQTRMISGGWRDAADKLIDLPPPNGPFQEDRLYFSKKVNGNWEQPVHIQWSNGGNKYSEPGKIKGLQINDPTIVNANNGAKLHMYYTAFPFALPPLPPVPFQEHKIGFATSTDGGVTWYDYGIVHEPVWGAWSPSAINIGGKTWVYYHTGEPGPYLRMQRQIFKSNGWQTHGVARDVSAPLTLVNLDVQKYGNTFVMLGNQQLSNVYRFVSHDGSGSIEDNGLIFTTDPIDVNPIINGGFHQTNTPHAERISGNNYNSNLRYRIYFGYDRHSHLTAPPLIPVNFRSMHAWDFRNRAASPSASQVVGIAWEDLDGDGVRDANEPRVAGRSVTLYRCGPPWGSAGTAITDATGSYVIGNLDPGDYQLGTPAHAPGFSPRGSDNDVYPNGFTSCVSVSGGADLGIGLLP